jgi:mannan endo-1,4-beta-mannosidase
MGDVRNIDSVPFARMKQWAIEAFEKGGISTYSWHMGNLAVSGSSWDTDPCVKACLPGGSMHGAFLKKLDLAAEFFSGLKTASGEMIPVVFRPFHEMNGGWFWWGATACTPEEYKELFRFTVDYLRKEKGLHQLVIAYSTDVFTSAEEYLTFYPGDGYVDVMGFDDYRGLNRKEETHRTVWMLETLDSLSRAHGKLMAITETGLETIPNPVWFTDVVLSTLKTSASTRRVSWILFWRNGRPDHFYAPYPGHPSAPDFIRFMNDSLICSLSELPALYK